MRRPIRPLAISLFALFCVSVVFATTKKPPAKPVNLNTATSEQLQAVPGIGPATAEKIIQMRKSYGAFKSVDDLRAIRGIGPKRLEKMRRYLSVGKPASSPTVKPQPAAAAKQTTKQPDPEKPNPEEKDPPRLQ